jgi:hypothetical protein
LITQYIMIHEGDIVASRERHHFKQIACVTAIYVANVRGMFV